MINDWQDHPIFLGADGSYVITHNGNPYRVPDTESKPELAGEFGELWQAINAFAQDNPDKVQPESERPPRRPPPTPEEQTALRIAEIKARLNELDAESVRPLRAIANGTDDPDDHQKLAELDSEAATLREELRGLEA